MKNETETVKGFQDFLPPESQKRAEIKKIVEKFFQLYGFLPVETPLIEFDSLMSSPDDKQDQAVSDRFRLKDRGGRELGLRYEFTFQLARLFKQNPNIKLPLKRYQIGEVFRDEPVSSTRFRQFTQCDIDIVGDSSINAEAECLACFSDILKKLKIDYEVVVNNRRLLNSILESVEISQKESVLRELDKVDKLGIDQVKSNLREYASANQIVTLFKLLEKDLAFFKKNVFEGVEDLEEIIELCQDCSIKLKFSPLLMRGLGYYTGDIFEIRVKDSKDSIAGGGRYDKTVGKFIYKEVPAVGISFGLERLTQLAKIKIPSLPKVLLISISQDTQTILLARTMRKKGISCSISFVAPGKALEYANSYKIPYTIFIGEEEVGKKKYKLRNMESGKEELLTEKQLVNKLK